MGSHLIVFFYFLARSCGFITSKTLIMIWLLNLKICVTKLNRFIYIYIIFPIYIEIYREYYITLLGPKASLATLMMLYDPTRSWEASAI